MRKILFVRHQPLNEPWYVENHIEYVIRYLGNKYYFDLAKGIEYDMVQGYPDNYQPVFGKNPADYDIIIPLYTKITHLEHLEKWYHKMAPLVWETGEVYSDDVLCYGSTNKVTDRCLEESGKTYVKTRVGIDTSLFHPYPLKRTDNLLHVGFVGKVHSPRKLVKDLLMPLANIPGIRLMFYSQQPLPIKEIEYCGGVEFLKHLEGGNKSWIGMPNVYNNLDVLIESDADTSVSFPTLEAVACGVPVICSFGGLSQDIVDAGAGIHIIPDDSKQDPRDWAYNQTSEMAQKIRDAVIFMRDNPEKRIEMGLRGREEVLKNWTWRSCIGMWEEFIETALSKL